MSPPRRATAWQRRFLGLALCVLLCAQWLALVHAVGHPGGEGGAPQVQRGHPATLAQGLLKAVTAHGDKSAACQLYDHLVQPSPHSVVLVPVLASAAPQPLPAPACAPPAGPAPRHYHARAPPLLA